MLRQIWIELKLLNLLHRFDAINNVLISLLIFKYFNSKDEFLIRLENLFLFIKYML
jgi:hypothetical protein